MTDTDNDWRSDFKAGQAALIRWFDEQGVVQVKREGPQRIEFDENGDPVEWPHDLWVFHVCNRRKGTRTVTFEYRSGVANIEDHPDGPTMAEVLAAYCEDAMDYLANESWEDWASNYVKLDEITYREAQKMRGTYTELGKVSRRIARLLPGVDLFKVVGPLKEAAGW